MFKSASIKLTFFYVLILMAISIVFSIIIFQISTNEIDRGLGRQSRILRQQPLGIGMRFDPELETILSEQFNESRDRLVNQLVYFNLIILLLSTLGSYLLAKKTLQPIEEMVEAQNRFTADASHELRTPLSAMRSEIEVSLRDKKMGLEQAKNLLHSNLEEIDKLDKLSSALLKLARLEKDNQNAFMQLGIDQILVGAYQKVESAAKKKNIEFENELEDVKVKGDEASLIELFIILLDNAIKYSPDNSKIYISTKAGKDRLIVKIKDQGMGIKASDLPYIFNRFYRADASRNQDKIAGYGLGLAIAKQIVELHKGSIEVNSVIGEGSEFVVKFDIA